MKRITMLAIALLIAIATGCTTITGYDLSRCPWVTYDSSWAPIVGGDSALVLRQERRCE